MPTTAIDHHRDCSTSPAAAETYFRLLGPLQVVREGQLLEVPRGRQQALLASLLVRPNEPIEAHSLIEQIWGTSRTRADRSVLNVYVMRLRRSLGDHQHDLLRVDGGGYRLSVAESNIDLCRFRELCALAASFQQRGDPGRERNALHQALALWRGEPFTGLRLPTLQAEVQPLLEEERLQALERRVDADLACREHHTLVRELQELVSTHPFRERFWCQLMTALCRTGRRREALEAYPTVRRLFVEELGVEPGAELRQLHQRILSQDDDVLDPAASAISLRPANPSPTGSGELGAPLVPAQLPPDVAGFRGRRRQLRRLDEALPTPARGDPDVQSARSARSARSKLSGLGRPAPIVLITGAPGVGKTALAVHWATRASGHGDRFVDGQLYLDLRGYAAEPAVRPAEALGHLLRSLGVPANRIPHDLSETIALYRSLTAGRRMLVLLDNARSAEQVRPLLPNGNRSVVIVTSRDQLSGLVAREGAHPLVLDVLPRAEARSLLAWVLGAERLAAEPTATDALIRICDQLPLALRIAAANLLTCPGRPTADFVDELESRNRLDALRVPNDPPCGVRSSLAFSYGSLAPAQRRAFVLLGLLPGPVLCPDTVAALIGTDRQVAAQLLNELAAAHLVRPRPDGRYLLPGLLRLYAADRARTDLPWQERAAALARLYERPVRIAGEHARRLYPELAGSRSAAAPEGGDIVVPSDPADLWSVDL